MRHTQSAGGIVINKNGQILIVKQDDPSSWSLPKGHIKKEENPLDTAKREIYEESGISQLIFLSDLGSYKRYKMLPDRTDDISEEKTIFMFLFKTDQSTLHPIHSESKEARWIEIKDVTNLLTHHKDKEFFLSIINQTIGFLPY
jgi:bis(5'-nucleosidyl)-tetraphosphatase